jgi:hypothetical protein
MRKLDTGDRAHAMHETRNPGQRLNMAALPNATVAGSDAPLRRHRRRFHKNHARSTHCAAAQMYQVPVIQQSVDSAVLTHRRDADAIAQRHAANSERA